ncbi:hypothetical protein KA005_06785 [bacterium]|nr:hypothetical protein [bacterium]
MSEVRIMQPFAVACVLGTGELVLKTYEAESKEEALGLLFFDIQLQGQMKDRSTYIEDFKVIPAKEDALAEIALQELNAGRRIGAIREVRAYTGWGLREAKVFVDDVRARHPELDA